MSALETLLERVKAAIKHGEPVISITAAENDEVMADPAVKSLLNCRPVPGFVFPGVKIVVV